MVPKNNSNTYSVRIVNSFEDEDEDGTLVRFIEYTRLDSQLDNHGFQDNKLKSKPIIYTNEYIGDETLITKGRQLLIKIDQDGVATNVTKNKNKILSAEEQEQQMLNRVNRQYDRMVQCFSVVIVASQQSESTNANLDNTNEEEEWSSETGWLPEEIEHHQQLLQKLDQIHLRGNCY